MQQLVDAGDVAGIMALVDLDSIAATWVAYHDSADHPVDTDDDPHWWAVELLMSVEWNSDGRRVRGGLLALCRAATGDDSLEAIGAGPIENVLHRPSADQIEWVISQASEDSQFRRALQNVWIWDDVSEDDFVRIEAAAGAPLVRPQPG